MTEFTEEASVAHQALGTVFGMTIYKATVEEMKALLEVHKATGLDPATAIAWSSLYGRHLAGPRAWEELQKITPIAGGSFPTRPA